MKLPVIKRMILKTAGLLLAACLLWPAALKAQEDYPALEKMQDKNMNYIKKLSQIAEQYPAFSYSYEVEDGAIKNVTVTGIEDTVDTKQIKVVLLDLQSNKNELKNKANRMGVFYSVDENAMYKDGRDALNNALHENLKYPEGAKDWGVEGTVYVRFVVDEKGNIPYAATTNDIDTNMDFYLEDLEKQAVNAVKRTSGDWKAGKINGVKVPSFVVIPITFDLKKDPYVPFML